MSAGGYSVGSRALPDRLWGVVALIDVVELDSMTRYVERCDEVTCGSDKR